MRTTILVFAAVVCAACNNNGDLDNDGTVSASEYCQTMVRLECEIVTSCTDGSTDFETCVANTPLCDYLARRCDGYDEDRARACITEVSAYLATCEEGDGNPVDDMSSCFHTGDDNAVFTECVFGE